MLAQRLHSGPLAVQKALYPEGPAVCHTLIVHPPGGIAANDLLEITVSGATGSHAVISMPGAAKWYRSNKDTAVQKVTLRVEHGAVLEWLPPEAIVFDGARAKLHTTVELDGGASFIGWDIICFGRTAAGETFVNGDFDQTIDVTMSGKRAWIDRCRIRGGSPLFESAVGMGGAPVTGVFIAAGATATAELVVRCREITLEAPARNGVTALPGMMLARYTGFSTEQAKQYFAWLRQVLRPAFAKREASPLRIWST